MSTLEFSDDKAAERKIWEELERYIETSRRLAQYLDSKNIYQELDSSLRKTRIIISEFN